MHQRTNPPTGSAPRTGRRGLARKALLAASALGVVTALMAPVRAGAMSAVTTPSADAASSLTLYQS
ncbi:glycoside hydrolase family 5 protein, partial [Streptomyces sp. ID01-9D]|nr:glycoside hydrolase family 5 protein [Streptomyces sp. ID01-9D]